MSVDFHKYIHPEP